MAQEAWRAYLELALGMTDATRKKATKAVRRLVGKGGVTAEQLQALAEELVKTSTANREALTKLVRYELDRALGKVGLATAEEVADLTNRVRELEAQLRVAHSGPASSGEAAAVGVAATRLDEPVPSPRKKAVAKKIAKKAVRPALVETGALVQSANGAGAAEPLAPPAAKRAVAKSAAAKSAVAKSAVAKKTIAKKSVAKTAMARTAVAKATRAKVTAANVTPAKAAPTKTVAKKAPTRTPAKTPAKAPAKRPAKTPAKAKRVGGAA
jgi:polyhydroxyalkanoate synthesis regulator phasin